MIHPLLPCVDALNVRTRKTHGVYDSFHYHGVIFVSGLGNLHIGPHSLLIVDSWLKQINSIASSIYLSGAGVLSGFDLSRVRDRERLRMPQR